MIVAQSFFRTLTTRVVESRQCVHVSSSSFRNGTFFPRRKPSIFYQQRFLSDRQPKDWIAVAKRAPLSKFVAGAVLCAISGIPVSYAYATYVGSGNDCLEKGAVSLALQEYDSFVVRQELQKDLERMLTPTTPRTFKPYYLITGEVGIGKTAAIKHACRKIGSGVIYVEVPMSAGRFAAALAEATGYKGRESGFFPWRNRTMPIADHDRWNAGNWYAVYENFKQMAKLYTAKHDKTPVLVIDNVNILAIENPEMLQKLQRGAKLGIDHGDFVVVFVTSDEMAPDLLKSNSAFSRGTHYRIGDINQAEAFEYLQKCGLKDVDGTLYSKVFNLVGGRLLLLENITYDLKSGKSFEDVKNQLLKRVEYRIGRCFDRLVTGEKAICQAIVECALAKREFSYEDVEDHLGFFRKTFATNNISAVMDKMISAELLSDRAGSVVKSFQSMLVWSYFKEHPRRFG